MMTIIFLCVVLYHFQFLWQWILLSVVGGGGFWDEVAQNAPKPSGKPVGGKAKPSTATSGSGNNPSGKATGSKTRSKKEEALVMKLFEQNVSRGDEFTQWCNKALSGLQSSVDSECAETKLERLDKLLQIQKFIWLNVKSLSDFL